MIEPLKRENARLTLRRWIEREAMTTSRDKRKLYVEEAARDIARLARYLGVNVADVRADVQANGRLEAKSNVCLSMGSDERERVNTLLRQLIIKHHAAGREEVVNDLKDVQRAVNGGFTREEVERMLPALRAGNPIEQG